MREDILYIGMLLVSFLQLLIGDIFSVSFGIVETTFVLYPNVLKTFFALPESRMSIAEGFGARGILLALGA